MPVSKSRSASSIGVVAIIALALAGCAAGDGPTDGSPSPSTAAPTPSPSPTVDPRIEADAALLPLPPEEIREWAKTAVPAPGSEGYESGYAGWLSEHTSKNQINDYTTLEPGAYVIQLACRGEGTITAALTTLDDQPVGTEAQACENGTVAFDATTVTPGLRTTLTLEGAPTIFAMSFQTVPAAG